MIELERPIDYRAMGFTQQPHGVPMYKILYAIANLQANQRMATSTAIAEIIGKYPGYANSLARLYWQWDYVSRKLVKGGNHKRRKAKTKCIFFWELKAKGRKKLLELKTRFGAMVEVDTPANGLKKD